MSYNTTTPTWVFSPIETLPLDQWEPSANSADGGLASTRHIFSTLCIRFRVGRRDEIRDDEWTASQINEGIFDGYNYQMARNIDGDFAVTIAANAHNQFVTCQDMLSSESPVQTASVQNGNVTHATEQMHAVATPVDRSLQPTISLPQQTSASKATRRKTTKKVAKPRKTRSKGKENAPPTARAKATSSIPVACLFPNCPKSYADARERNRHMLIHFPFQFVCQEAGCTKAFSRGDLLRRHWRDQHQTNEDDRSNYTSPKPAFPWDVDPEAFNKLRTPSSDVTDKTGKFVLRAKTNPQFYASHFGIYQSS
ncbi:hypothetical protein A0H81_06885 [Grifola frondosa]|uniref:C2H2-type domain-containing protein n=1 Tax=Grifola frondosa TaxID=5627 RepID=A0A1C7M7G3_GRIFR|nr:hypothetical protein A0H81_06885 [Grifola frondosa]